MQKSDPLFSAPDPPASRSQLTQPGATVRLAAARADRSPDGSSSTGLGNQLIIYRHRKKMSESSAEKASPPPKKKLRIDVRATSSRRAEGAHEAPRGAQEAGPRALHQQGTPLLPRKYFAARRFGVAGSARLRLDSARKRRSLRAFGPPQAPARALRARNLK